MRTASWVMTGAASLMLLGAAGCGNSKAEAEQLLKETVAAYDSCTAALEGVKDEATAKEASAKLAKIGEQVAALSAKLDALKLPKSDGDALMTQYKPKMFEAGKKMGMAFAAAKLKGLKVEIPTSLTGGQKLE